MPHAHAHHPHPSRTAALNRAFAWGIVLNVAFVAAECVAGLWYGSIGLLSDAGHNLSDVAGLVLALVAFRLARRRPTARYNVYLWQHPDKFDPRRGSLRSWLAVVARSQPFWRYPGCKNPLIGYNPPR